MKRSKFIIVLIMGLLAVPQVSFSESLEEKVARLEDKVASLEKSGGSGLSLEGVSLSGLIEVDVLKSDDDAAAPNEDSSDITLATVELAVDAKINENVEGHVLLLYEEDAFADDRVIVDEGTITITSPYGLSLAAGKMYVPFGNFNSHLITDPMTQDLGETRETALLLTYGDDKFSLSLGIYNGDVDETGDDNEIDDVVASLSVSPAEGITIGASYISDIADSDAGLTGATISDTVAGYSAFLSATFGPLTLEAEYLAAIDEFQTADFDANTDGIRDEPSAINVELAMAIGEKAELAIRWEESDDAALFKERLGVAAACEIFPKTKVIFEYMTAEYDDNSGNDVDTITAELAIEF